jgi:hypothetical protein
MTAEEPTNSDYDDYYLRPRAGVGPVDCSLGSVYSATLRTRYCLGQVLYSIRT